jgi:hypothetical protein
MRMVLAVTEPLLAEGPNAETQSPTARALDATVCVVLTGVELVVVTFSDSVSGLVGFFDLLLELRVKFPGEIETPETVSVEPFTAVTFPEAMSRLANCLAKLPPPVPLGKLGRVPPGPLPPEPLRKLNPPGGGPPDPFPPVLVPNPPAPALAPQVPALLGAVKVMLRAAMVVLDLLDADPVAVTQSPAATALTDSVAVLENVVVDVQFTVVWPLFGFCTSILDAPRAATLPVAPIGGFELDAAPAVEATATAASSAAAPVPRIRAELRNGVRRPVGVSMIAVASFLFM